MSYYRRRQTHFFVKLLRTLVFIMLCVVAFVVIYRNFKIAEEKAYHAPKQPEIKLEYAPSSEPTSEPYVAVDPEAWKELKE